MLLLGQATPHSPTWVVSTDPFVCITVEAPLSAQGLQHMKAFLWVPPGDGQPDTALVRRMVDLYAHDLEFTASPTTFDIVQGSPDPAHTPPAWLVCDSPLGAEPVWNGLIHTASPVAVVEHRHSDAEVRSTLALQWPGDITGIHRLTGSAVFDAFYKELFAMPPPPGTDSPTRR